MKIKPQTQVFKGRSQTRTAETGPVTSSSKNVERKDGEKIAKDGKAASVEQREPDVYDRFSVSQKHAITAIVSFTAFLSPIASSAFLPSIPIMAEQLNTTDSVIDYTVAIFILAIGLAPIIWSPMAGFYGRKAVILTSMPLMTFGSIGVALSNNIGALIGTRILQGIGSSAVLSVGAGVIGDIYRPTERANAMSWFYSGILLGPSLSPVIAGLFTEYTSETWRSTQYFLIGLSATSILLTFFFLPETSHPPLPHKVACVKSGKRFVLYVFNPLTSLGLFRWPNIVVATSASSAIMLQLYCIVVPLTTVYKTRYNITNTAISGCLYLVTGGGNLVGSRIIGPYADRIVLQWLEKRGYRRPEDRLRSTLWGAAVVSPVSCLIYGWLVQTGAGGIAPSLVMLFFNGVGLMIILGPLNTYLVDAMQSRSAEVIAVNNCIRYIFAAASSAFTLPMADKIGFGWTMTFATVVGYIALFCILLCLRYGDKWREAANLRYGVTRIEADEVRVDGGKDEEEAVVENSGPLAVGHSLEIGFGDMAVSEETVVVGEGDGDEEKGSSHSDEEAHGHPAELKAPPQSTMVGVSRKSSRKANTSSTVEVPTIGEVLSRTVSLSSASVHGGG